LFIKNSPKLLSANYYPFIIEESNAKNGGLGFNPSVWCSAGRKSADDLVDVKEKSI